MSNHDHLVQKMIPTLLSIPLGHSVIYILQNFARIPEESMSFLVGACHCANTSKTQEKSRHFHTFVHTPPDIFLQVFHKLSVNTRRIWKLEKVGSRLRSLTTYTMFEMPQRHVPGSLGRVWRKTCCAKCCFSTNKTPGKGKQDCSIATQTPATSIQFCDFDLAIFVESNHYGKYQLLIE